MSQRKIDLRRWVRRVLSALVAVYAVYLIAIHALLATPLLRRLTNKKPDKFLLEYGSAWSVVPGRVHVKGLRLRLKDSVAETYLAFDTVDTRIDLLALPKKILRLRGARVQGATVRVRPRLDPEDLTPQTMEGMPDIPGFDAPPRTKTDPREPPEFDKYWTIDLHEVEIDPVREIWLGPYRFAGDARVSGGFYLKPLQEFELRRSTMEVRDGVLTLARRPFGRDLRGAIEVRIARHDPRALDGGEMFRKLDATIRAGSTVDDLGFVQRWLVPKIKTVVTGGGGHAESEVRIASGVLQEGTFATFQSEKALVRHPPFSAWVDSDVRLGVERGALRLHLRAHRLRLERRYAESYPIRSDQLDLVAVSRSLDLAREPFDDVLLSLDVPRATITDLRMLTGVFGDQIAPQGGVAYLKGHVDLSPREALANGELSLDAPRLAAKSSTVAFVAHVAAGLTFKRLDLATMTGSVPSAYLDIRDAALSGQTGAPPPAWWGRVDLAAGALDSAQKPAFAADLVGRARDARPIVFLATQKQGIPSWAREPLAMENLSLTGKLHVGPGVAVESLTGHGGSIDIEGRLKKAQKKTEGHVTLSYGPFALTINLVPRNVGGGPR